MNMENTNIDVETIVAEFATDRELQGSGTNKTLRDWVEQYPFAKDELVAHALYSPLEREVHFDPAELDAISLVVASTAVRVRERMKATHPLYRLDAVPIKDIRTAAKDVNLEVSDLVRLLGISKTVLAKLDKRLVIVETIPATVFNALAEALKRTVDEVRDYFSLPPSLSPNASYRAKAAPSVNSQETFETAILSASDMTAEQKAEWKSQTTDGDSK